MCVIGGHTEQGNIERRVRGPVDVSKWILKEKNQPSTEAESILKITQALYVHLRKRKSRCIIRARRLVCFSP